MQETKNLKICKASAGSGKTYRLVLEYITLALSNREESDKKFKSILAVTFTNMAANEMKERIVKELKYLAAGTFENQDYLEVLKERLKTDAAEIQKRAERTLSAILHNYGDFSVMTIDKFVHRITRAFSKEFGIAPDFDIEMNADEVNERIVAALMDQAGSDPEITTLLKQALLAMLNENKNWDIKRELKEFAKLLQMENIRQKLEQLDTYHNDDLIEYRDKLTSAIASYEKSIAETVTTIEKLLENCGLSLDHLNSYFGNALKKLQKGKIEQLSGKTYWENALNGKFFTAKDKDSEELFNPHVADMTATVSALDELLHGEAYVKYKDRIVIRKNIFLTGIISRMKDIASEIRKQDNFLMISDFYQLITQMILHEPVAFIYERLGNRYEHFLIDEFQDTSVLQWLNFIPLMENSLAQGKTNFIVGDIKQSIYRFRNGEVEQFKSLPRLYNPDNNPFIEEKQISFIHNEEKLSLNINRRSAPVIVDFNNEFFKNLTQKSEKFKELANYYEDLEQEASKKSPQGYVRMYNLNDKDKDKEEIKSFEKNEILKVIAELIKTGYDYRDMCILTKKNSTAIEMASFLLQNAIPVVSKESLKIISHPAVKAVVYYVKMLLNPSDSRLLSIFLENYFKVFPEKSKAVPFSYSVHQNGEDGKEKIKTVLKLLALESNIEKLIKSSLYRTMERVVYELKISVNKQAYIQFMLDSAQEYGSRESGNIALFTEWFLEKGGEKSIKIPDETNAVQLLTIHRSKGLQYKIVIIPQASFSVKTEKTIAIKASDNDKVKEVIVNPENGTSWEPEKTEENRKKNLDVLNIYYVGFTRAEQQLYIFNLDKDIQSVAEEMKGAEKHHDKVEFITWGKPESREETTLLKEKEEINKVKLDRPIYPFRNEEIPKFAFFAGEDETKEINEKIESGKVLHEILSHIETPDTWQKDVAALSKKKQLKLSKDHEIKIRKIINNKDLEPFFSKSGKQLSERAIILPSGEKKIPDRVTIHENEVWVLDYKTGSPRNSDKKQVEEYMEIIKQIEKKPVKGFIFYLENDNLISV